MPVRLLCRYYQLQVFLQCIKLGGITAVSIKERDLEVAGAGHMCEYSWK